MAVPPTTPPPLFDGISCTFKPIYSSHPTFSPTLLMHLWSQATVDIHYAALSPLSRSLRPRPSGEQA